MLQLVADTRETLSYRLPALFDFAKDARKRGARALATRAGAFLLGYALNDDPHEKRIEVRIASTDLYGDASGQTKYDLVKLTYKPDPQYRIVIPIPLLTPDAIGRCYRRAGGDIESRSFPSRSTRAPVHPTHDELAKLATQYQLLVGQYEKRFITKVLKEA